MHLDRTNRIFMPVSVFVFVCDRVRAEIVVWINIDADDVNGNPVKKLMGHIYYRLECQFFSNNIRLFQHDMIFFIILTGTDAHLKFTLFGNSLCKLFTNAYNVITKFFIIIIIIINCLNVPKQKQNIKRTNNAIFHKHIL